MCGGWWLLCRLDTDVFLALFPICSPQRSFVLYCLTCDMCLRFRGCPVELDIELSVSARHQKTRVLRCAPRLVLLLVAAAASGGVRHKISKLHAMRAKPNNELGQSEHQKKTIFGAPLLRNWGEENTSFPRTKYLPK